MAKNDGSNSLVFMSGVVLGSVVGAAAALLFAPASGEETRDKLGKKGKKAIGDVKKQAGKVGEQISPMIENLRSEVDEKLEEVKKGFERGVSQQTKKKK